MVRWLLHGPLFSKVREAVNWLVYSVLDSEKGSIDQKEGRKDAGTRYQKCQQMFDGIGCLVFLEATKFTTIES